MPSVGGVIDDVSNALVNAADPFARAGQSKSGPNTPPKDATLAQIQGLLGESGGTNKAASYSGPSLAVMMEALKSVQGQPGHIVDAVHNAVKKDLAAYEKAHPTTAAEPAGEATTQEMEQQLQSANVWNTLGQGLVTAQQNLEKPVEKAISGGLTAPATATAENTALSCRSDSLRRPQRANGSILRSSRPTPTTIRCKRRWPHTEPPTGQASRGSVQRSVRWGRPTSSRLLRHPKPTGRSRSRSTSCRTSTTTARSLRTWPHRFPRPCSTTSSSPGPVVATSRAASRSRISSHRGAAQLRTADGEGGNGLKFAVEHAVQRWGDTGPQSVKRRWHRVTRVATKVARPGIPLGLEQGGCLGSEPGHPVLGLPARLPVGLHALLQQGFSPMSAAERNRAILAANNPNNVTPLPSDNPSPTSILGNARTDLGSIVTGLEPQHLVANLFDTVFNTAKDVIDPKRLIGKNLDATAANVLQDTLLSFVPGAYDLGSFVRAGGGVAGFDALAQHPLVSLLDVLPAGSSKLLSGALADTELGAKLAEAGGMSKDAFGEMSMQQILGNVLKNHVTSKSPLGFDPSGASSGIHKLTVGERLQTWAGQTKLGTSKPIQDLIGEYMLNNQLYTGIKQNLEAPALHAYEALGPEEKVIYNEMFRRQSQGDDWQRLPQRPEIPLSVRDAARKMVNGPLRFETEQAILGATGDVAPIRRPDGRVGLYSGTGHEAVKNAKDTLTQAHSDFVANLDATDRLRQVVEAMDTHLPVLGQGLTQANRTAARQAIPQDESLLANVITETEGKPGEMVRQTFGRKADQAKAMFGEGGLVDSVLEAVRGGDTDLIRGRAEVFVFTARPVGPRFRRGYGQPGLCRSA